MSLGGEYVAALHEAYCGCGVYAALVFLAAYTTKVTKEIQLARSSSPKSIRQLS